MQNPILVEVANRLQQLDHYLPKVRLADHPLEFDTLVHELEEITPVAVLHHNYQIALARLL